MHRTLSLLAISLALAGCGSSAQEPLQVNTGRATVEESPAPDTATEQGHDKEASSSNYSAPADQKTATIADVKAAIQLGHELENQAQSMASEWRCGLRKDAPAHLEMIGEEINPWREREKKFEDRIAYIAQHARGNTDSTTRVGLAAENLNFAQTWLWSAVDSEAFSKPARGKTYLKGVSLALDRAEKNNQWEIPY